MLRAQPVRWKRLAVLQQPDRRSAVSVISRKGCSNTRKDARARAQHSSKVSVIIVRSLSIWRKTVAARKQANLRFLSASHLPVSLEDQFRENSVLAKRSLRLPVRVE